MKAVKSALIILFAAAIIQIVRAGNYSDKPVSLTNSVYTYKNVFKILSDQSGYIFSYNPLVLPDNQSVTITNISGIKLSAALKKILPTGFTFSISGKYIVIQKQVEKQFKKSEKTKFESRLDKNQKSVALVVPNVNEDTPITNTNPPVKDSIALIMPTTALLVTDKFILTQKNSLYTSKMDSAEIRRFKTKYFIRKNVDVEFGIASSSPISSLIAHAGIYGLYGIFSVSSDYNNSYRMGYGIGYTYNFENNMGISLSAERNVLFAGTSYNLGVRAILTHIDPLATFAISRDFTWFIGPSFYISESNYINANTDLGKTMGVGALVGVKFNLISALLEKK